MRKKNHAVREGTNQSSTSSTILWRELKIMKKKIVMARLFLLDVRVNSRSIYRLYC